MSKEIAVLCYDIDDSGPLREAAMQAHFAHIEAVLDELALAGPLFDQGGERIIGSLFIVRADNRERAQQLIEADPYFKAGVWRTVTYLPFLPAAGSYIGGTIW